jgi:hypothetical protein
MSWVELRNILLPGLTAAQQRTVVVSVVVLAFGFHVAWACGYVPGVAGFATEDQVEEVAISAESAEQAAEAAREEARQLVQEVQSSVVDLQSEILEERISNLQTLRCRTDDSELHDQYSARINRNMAKYRSINGYYFQLTPCTDY